MLRLQYWSTTLTELDHQDVSIARWTQLDGTTTSSAPMVSCEVGVEVDHLGTPTRVQVAQACPAQEALQQAVQDWRWSQIYLPGHSGRNPDPYATRFVWSVSSAR